MALRVQADLRHRWGAWLALALLIGVFAGGVIAIAAGAVRTDSAYPRLVRMSDPPDDMLIASDPRFASIPPATLARLQSLVGR